MRAGRGLGHQGVAGREQVGVADRDDVAVAQHRAGDQGAVDEGAVAAVVVADLQAGRRGHAAPRARGRPARPRRRRCWSWRARSSPRPLNAGSAWPSPTGRRGPVGSAAAAVPWANRRSRRWSRAGAGARSAGTSRFGARRSRRIGCGVRLFEDCRVVDGATRNVSCGPCGLPSATLRRSRIGHHVGARTVDVEPVLAFVDQRPTGRRRTAESRAPAISA